MYFGKYDKNMKLNKFIILFIFTVSLFSCADYKVGNKDHNKKADNYYSASGFVLIYNEDLYKEKIINKKMNNNDLLVMHSTLKRNTLVEITNPVNSKSVKIKIYRKAQFPKIFHMVVNNKVATLLDLDLNNPFVEINQIKKNKKFIAKEGNTYDEEKNVADKAPVDEISMNDLSKNKIEKEKKLSKNMNYVILISDFYFEDSANNLKAELMKKIELGNISVKKINNNKYRLLAGPFENFNALKTIYISLNNLGFESLDVYKE